MDFNAVLFTLQTAKQNLAQFADEAEYSPTSVNLSQLRQLSQAVDDLLLSLNSLLPGGPAAGGTGAASVTFGCPNCGHTLTVS